MAQKITPFLWFDKEAGEAARFYTSVFKDGKIKSETKMENTPSGTVEVLSIELFGQEFTLMSAGPLFKFNPSISLTITCSTPEEADDMYKKLSGGGEVLMEFQKYPWSERYGWFNDKYGVSWQINTEKEGGKIIPTFLFTQKNFGKCEEALNFYTGVFKNSSVGGIFRYEKGEADEEGKVKHAEFTLEGQTFRALESSLEHKFIFNEALSLMVNCENQEEVDYYWGNLSAHPESEQCGWLKDKYGLSWQITPRILGKLTSDPDKAKAGRVTAAMLKMKKINVAGLEKAYAGE